MCAFCFSIGIQNVDIVLFFTRILAEEYLKHFVLVLVNKSYAMTSMKMSSNFYPTCLAEVKDMNNILLYMDIDLYNEIRLPCYNKYMTTGQTLMSYAGVIITVGHRLKSGQLARLPPISLFGLTNVRSTMLNSKLWFSPALLF